MSSSTDANRDPVVLAHLGAAAIGLVVDPASLPEPRAELPLDLSGRQERLANVADGIAYCAVRKAKHEVIAVNVALRQKEIVILLAGNDGVSSTTIEHVGKMWECLVQISRMVNEQTGESGDTELISPETNHEFSEIEPVRRLQSLVYQFCLARFRKTFNKWNKSPYETETIVTQIFQILKFFGAISRLLNTGRGVYMDAVSTLAQCVLTNPGGCEYWEGSDLANLITALEKCTSLHRHMECLIRCARSTRLRPCFQKACNVRTCPKMEMSVQSWPQTPSAWLESTRALLGTRAATKSVEKIATIANQLCNVKVHVEVQITLHLLSEQSTARSAIAYIGVSKLSCGPCNIFLHAIRAARGGNLALRRSHSKWYPGWGMPSDQVLATVLTPEELRILKECLVKELKRHILSFVLGADSQNVRISDSTDPSIDGRHTKPQEWKVQRAYQLLAGNDDQQKIIGSAVHNGEPDFFQPGFLISTTVIALFVYMWSLG
ncbi:hypothetical protein L211DRAFT_871058 [Terfezia boudieri ATCC MYA-4762]|uniref:Uncharacterized protein n=1 Tax=Terfezia boudieri ATCC MYA-4762 TaxID=1051890 RepID=A0A3N4LPA2_9PEZI|nr:hypothetical protein L211DRAFT_871058 [Terfezia boudieri ATCC MYA-4762]